MSESDKLKIQILIDDEKSWLHKYIPNLLSTLKQNNYSAKLCTSEEQVGKGDILFLLGCTKIYKNYSLNKHNLVIHESALPVGKGWSPLTWQILEGKNIIPITLFEASNKVDSGDIYFQEFIQLNGTELFDEIKQQQFAITLKLILTFLKNYPDIKAKPQVGKSSYYEKRTSKDSELNINKTISEQFNLLRVVDNENYPAFFIKDGIKYILKIKREA